MKRLLSFLIIVGLVVFAGFKASVWWLADQRLGDARTALSEAGVLQKGSIGSSLDGRLILKQSSWQDFRLTQPLELGLAELDAGSPLSLLMVLANPESLPQQWQLTVERASIALEPVMFRNWVTAGAEAEGDAALPPLFVVSCAPDPRQQLGSGDLTRMGIGAISGELLLAQEPDGLRAELNTAGTGSLELVWQGARLQLAHSELTLADADEPARMTLRDAGLMRRLSAYCARETGQTVNEWAGRAATALQAGLEARGYQPSEQLIALYRQWLTEGGELVFPVQPEAPMQGLALRTEQAPDALWPVTYNGASVPDLYLTEVQPEQPVLPAEALVPATPRQDSEGQQWYVEALESADNWLGRQVRVTLSNDNEVEGRLVSVGERELEISRTVAGGEVAYPILIRAIARFEVWRRGQSD